MHEKNSQYPPCFLLLNIFNENIEEKENVKQHCRQQKNVHQNLRKTIRKTNRIIERTWLYI
jgi:hypothetical protein